MIKAADVMTVDVITVDRLATVSQAAKMMQQHNVKTLIVDRSSDSDAYGIITATDIYQAIAKGKEPTTTYVCEVMTQPCIVVNPNLAVEQVVKLFARAKIRIAPVIQDSLLGIISLTDILTKTECLTSDRVKFIYNRISNMPEVAVNGNRASIDQWEVADWERDFDNWCSG